MTTGKGIGISPFLKRFPSSGVIPPVTINEYIFRPLNLNSAFPPMDGAKYVSFGSKMRLLGGWDGVTPTFNTIYDTTDGIIFTLASDTMPYAMHTFNAGVRNVGSEIWTWGADGQLAISSGLYPVTKYNGTIWSIISSDISGTPFGTRIMSAGCIHKNYMLAIGGNDTTVTSFFQDCVRSSDGLSWTSIGTLPAGFYGNGSLASNGDVLVFGGGGANGASIYNDKIFISYDDGFNWTVVSTLPIAMQTEYVTMWFWDDKLWFQVGAKEAGGGDQRGLYYSTNFGATWTALYDSPNNTHASPSCVFNDTVYIASGSLNNYSYKLSKITQVNETPTGAFAYYSVRVPSTYSYSGPWITARRSSDDAEMDINYLSGEADTASLLSFVGGSNGFVKKIFDISGNGRHLTQSTNANQYQVVSSGSLITQGGKVALWAQDGTKNALTAGLKNLSTKYLLSGVVNISEENREFIGAYLYGLYNSPEFKIAHVAGANFGKTDGQYATNTHNILSLYRNDLIVQTFQSGNSFARSFAMNGNDDFNFTSLSGEGDPTYNLIGYIQEVIIFDTDILDKKPGMERNIKDYFNLT